MYYSLTFSGISTNTDIYMTLVSQPNVSLLISEWLMLLLLLLKLVSNLELLRDSFPEAMPYELRLLTIDWDLEESASE